ncbi:MAG: hypothetical protein U0L31_02015 [Bifidobacteriaceae bacterium]|nr:hypothetical protein [Bifidobacteriaceae bacterium]
MRLLNKILSLAASAAIMLTGYSTPASAKTDTVSSLEAIAGIQNMDVHFVKIAAGWYHSLALDSNGHVWAWGDDEGKKLGIGRDEHNYTWRYDIPIRVKTDVKFVDIANTTYTCFGIDEEGHLWEWGSKGSISISGKHNDDAFPEIVLPDVKFKSLSASTSSLVAVDISGNVWAWGYNGFNGKVESDVKVASIAVGGYGHGLALDESGHLYDLVVSKKDETDVRSEKTCSLNRVEFGKKISQISIGDSGNVLVLDEDSYLWCKGTNSTGAVGDGTYEYRDNFVRVKTDKKFAQISSGRDSNFAISQDGELYSWGYNCCEQLGGGELESDSRNVPVQILKDKRIKYVSAGQSETVFAIDESGTSLAWGYNSCGQAGIGNFSVRTVSKPTRMAINIKFTQISASGNHAAAVDAEGHVWTWGSDEHGESGTERFENKTGGIVLTYSGSDFSKEKITKVSVGDKHVLALDSDGHVWGWGSNHEGQLVEEKAGGENWSPRNLFAGTEYADLVFTDIYAGATSSMAVDSDGNTWQWGTGEAETGKSADPGYDPGMPNTGLNFVQTAVGRDHRLCLDESGIVRSWGRNDYGQLGHCKDEKYCYPDDKTRRIDVYKIDVYKDDVKFAQVAAGDGFSVALDTEGRIWTWGRNDKGQLGNYVSASKRETPGYVFR